MKTLVKLENDNDFPVTQDFAQFNDSYHDQQISKKNFKK
jgi:hypothetical protein